MLSCGLMAACEQSAEPIIHATMFDSQGGVGSEAVYVDQFAGGAGRLAMAAAKGDRERIRQLIRHNQADPNAVSEVGMPLLLWPVHVGNLDGFEALLENGADPNRKALNGEIIMHYVVQDTPNDFLTAALRHGADPNALNRDGEYLIHIARRRGKWDAIGALLDAGADIDAFEGGIHGNTILSTTAGYGDFKNLFWLLERGADPTFALKVAPVPERVGAQPVLEDIFHRPVDATRYPEAKQWQLKCQALLRERGITPPPKPKRFSY